MLHCKCPTPPPTTSWLKISCREISRGLMYRTLDLKPEVTQDCGFESWLRQEVYDCSPGAAQLVCALGWVKCREHISLLIILCIIVYVTSKAHLSLICICIMSFLSLVKLKHTIQGSIVKFNKTWIPVLNFFDPLTSIDSDWVWSLCECLYLGTVLHGCCGYVFSHIVLL